MFSKGLFPRVVKKSWLYSKVLKVIQFFSTTQWTSLSGVYIFDKCENNEYEIYNMQKYDKKWIEN